MNEYILLALEEAKKSNDDIPVGAVIVKNNKVISKAHNEVIKRNDSTAHAEIIAIKEAISKLEKTLNAEIRRRVEANKALQAVCSYYLSSLLYLYIAVCLLYLISK